MKLENKNLISTHFLNRLYLECELNSFPRKSTSSSFFSLMRTLVSWRLRHLIKSTSQFAVKQKSFHINEVEFTIEQKCHLYTFSEQTSYLECQFNSFPRKK